MIGKKNRKKYLPSHLASLKETFALCGTRCVIFDREHFPKSRASASKYLNYTKRKQGLRFLNSKPRRSLYRLRLKFVQTTRVVCTDYS